MPSFLIAAILGETEAWVAIGVIAVWLVIMCLKVIGTDLDYAIRWHDLKVKAHALRVQHLTRLRELGIKHARR